MKINKNIFRLEHILESIEKIGYIVKDLDYGDYLEDLDKTRCYCSKF